MYYVYLCLRPAVKAFSYLGVCSLCSRTHFFFLAPEKMCTYIYPKLEKSHEPAKNLMNFSVEISVQEKEMMVKIL